MNKEALRELRERLEKATGPDTEIDLMLWQLAGYPHDNVWNAKLKAWSDVAPVSSSVDAALGLVERCLPECPGYTFMKLISDGTGFAELGEEAISGHAATLPLAILSALLSALEAQAE